MIDTMRFCLTVDLKNDPAIIESYEAYHRKVWPEILQSLSESGILSMQIYRLMNRMFMVIETTDDFSFEKKAEMDAANPKVQEWETLMSRYQKSLPFARPGEKWVLMKKIFEL